MSRYVEEAEFLSTEVLEFIPPGVELIDQEASQRELKQEASVPFNIEMEFDDSISDIEQRVDVAELTSVEFAKAVHREVEVHAVRPCQAVSASSTRAQERIPLWKLRRSYFSLGEWMRLSSRAKPISIESIPSSSLKCPAMGIEPPPPT